MRKVVSFRIQNDTWNYVVFVRIGGTIHEAEEWFEKKFQTGEREYRPFSNARMIAIEGEKSHLLWFERTPDEGRLAHEAFHSVAHVLRESGLRSMRSSNEECFAYLLEWTVNEIALKIGK